MLKQKKLHKNILIASIIIFLVIGISFIVGYVNKSLAHAEEISTNNEAVIRHNEKNVHVNSYRLEDNSGYYESQDKRGHVLKNNLINISVYAQSEISQPEVKTGKVSGYDAYGISGQSVSIRLSYNYSNPDNLLDTRNDIYSISNDTYQSVGDFKNIGIIGTGAVLFQKKTDPNGVWQWQTNDGETKKQLHTFNFTDYVELNEYYNTNDKYILYTPSGKDLSHGIFIKITFAYELKRVTTHQEKNFWGKWKDVTTTSYYNILETAEFYIVQNSGAVLFHNASNFGQVGEESESGAISINDYDTILDGDVTLNGFRLDTLGVSAYDITYKHNNEAQSHPASDGQFFFEQGRYDFLIRTKLGETISHTIFIDRREINDAIIGYFGQTLFTSDSKRIYSTGQYPTYIAGAQYHLNATDGTVSPVVGKLYRITEEDEEIEEHFVKNIEPIRNGFVASALTEPITEAGLYKAEFWNNVKCVNDNSEMSGDVYHFVFRFQIVEADTKLKPSLNQAYLNGLIGFSDFNSKYYSVSVPTKGKGNAIFAFADYGGAYDFAYDLERESIRIINQGYEYKGNIYKTQYNVLGAVDLAAKNRVVVKYFDATDPTSYQTADITGEKITELNYDNDVVVFKDDTEQNYLKIGLPFINERKYRYVLPADAELNGGSAIDDGVLTFAFIKVDDFETQSITLTLSDNPNIKYNIVYGTSVEYQLGRLNAPSGIYTVTEHNANNGDSEYNVVYIKPGDMTSSVNVSLFSDGEFTERVFDKNALNTERNISGFIINSITNELDPYGIVKVTHNGETSIFSIYEASGKLFSDGGVYEINVVDRLGNEMRFTIIITSPVGHVSIHLQLDEYVDDVQTEFNVFVGQEIDLPILKAADELFVFDGWLYNDILITNGKFAPSVSGDLYIWPQFTQKYTYLNFDSDGGAPVEKIKAEIGKELALPITTKDGWHFGGWKYGGNVYNGAYTPTTASPTFVAVWNFLETDIELYDGNLLEVITANVGDKVLLPFPSRPGYTFFGWRLDLGNEQYKIYYGQITKLENVEHMRLDALWIHDSAVEQDALAQGSGGRTAVYFIDGSILENDTIIAAVGTNIATPTPSRAGYVFVGWVWRTTPISGKIYAGETMIVPQNQDGKIVLEALWIARAVNSGTYVSGSIDKINGGTGILKSISDFVTHEPLSFACIILSVFVSAIIIFKLTKKQGLTAPVMQSSRLANQEKCTAYVIEKSNIVARRREYETQLKKKQMLKAFLSGFRLNPLSVTVCTALLMTVVMALTGVLGSWERTTVAVAETVQTVTFDQSLSVDEANDKQYLGGNFTLPYSTISDEHTENASPVSWYTDEEIYTSKEKVEAVEQNNVEITDEEAFLCAIIMGDLMSLGYCVFTAQARVNGQFIYGIGYSKYADAFRSEEYGDDITLYSAGFIALPNQPIITENDILNCTIVYETTSSEDIDEEKLDIFILTFSENYGPCHYVADDRYVVYSINSTDICYQSIPASEEVYNPEYGVLYSYDEGRIIFDPNIGKKSAITATSINTLLDPIVAENEYNRYIAEQTANGFTVDTMNFVYISYAALEAYCLSNQDERLLGIDVQEFYDMERTVGPNEYYTVDENGNLTKLEFPPNEDESKAGWLDRLFGAMAGIGFIVAGVIIVATVSVISCGAATAAAPYIMGAFIGAGMEVFMQTVIQGRPLKDVNWLRVGIAAVSGVLSAIPGVGWLGAGLIQGVTEAAMTAVDGGSLEDVLKAFAVGFVTGVAIHGVSKAISKIKFCFVAGTPVLMAAGYTKSIENVHPGDIVKSYNQVTGKIENKRVLQISENETDEIVTVFTGDGQAIQSTPGHKFYANNRWISAEDLRAGDILVSVNGEKVVVEKIQHDILENTIKVYNFEVQDNHTYLVGNGNGIVVHNSACNEEKYYSYVLKGERPGQTDLLYVGKGCNNRWEVSASRLTDQYGVKFERFDISGKMVEKDAFIQEAKWMEQYASDKSVQLVNMIASPGFKKGHMQISELLKTILFNNRHGGLH